MTLAVALAGAAAHAAPEPAKAAPPNKQDASKATATAAPAGDRIAQFLGERGLIAGAATEPSLVQQVRDGAAHAADWTSELVLSAMNFLGVRYRRGGDSADEGFDCSGFTRHVFEASIGLVLPRRANEQAKAKALEPVKRDQLAPGDLVFFNTLRSAFSHVGIYVGDGKFIHAPRAGGQVRVEDMRVAYWSKRFNGARRAVVGATPAPREAAPAQAALTPEAPAKPTAATAAAPPVSAPPAPDASIVY
ncbi:MAG TPA: C40 family peptidase [Methylibium sp.]|uniref:C40 family peptidase n=1 Tax=Methylibium sp. TaxID=2067992 RepID=UPI002DB84DE1|nr:C40 family peptidase [Methylibium sp.]HEU4459428.1 C40 family peptidase [Methylibium sp.]